LKPEQKYRNYSKKADFLKAFTADLHIHTCLSPCAELEMSPMKIVEEAVRKNIDIIAITDHNSAENMKGVKDAAENRPLRIFYGMEITTREEVHVLGYFPSLQDLNKFQKIIYSYLENTDNPQICDEQVWANGKDEVLGFCGKNLFSAVSLSIEKIVAEIHGCRGLAIAAHIDREGFGIIGQLGFIPDGLELDGVELYDMTSPLRKAKFPAITSSDAHQLDQIGKRTTTLCMMEPTFGEFRKALNNLDGRRVEA
jgi:3',5'-nucleoside bisphosphate phosphatase